MFRVDKNEIRFLVYHKHLGRSPTTTTTATTTTAAAATTTITTTTKTTTTIAAATTTTTIFHGSLRCQIKKYHELSVSTLQLGWLNEFVIFHLSLEKLQNIDRAARQESDQLVGCLVCAGLCRPALN